MLLALGCIWCQRLEPVWEAFAEETQSDQLTAGVSIVKVDCVANRLLCMSERVQAFPTLRFFKEKAAQSPDYRGDRTVEALMQFLTTKMSSEAHINTLPVAAQRDHRERLARNDPEEHPGCMMAGFLLVNRVPGNFHIEARSSYHNLNPVMANLSHQVHTLSFGPVMNQKTKKSVNLAH